MEKRADIRRLTEAKKSRHSAKARKQMNKIQEEVYRR